MVAIRPSFTYTSPMTRVAALVRDVSIFVRHALEELPQVADARVPEDECESWPGALASATVPCPTSPGRRMHRPVGRAAELRYGNESSEV